MTLTYSNLKVTHNSNDISASVENCFIERVGGERSDSTKINVNGDLDVSWGDEVKIERDVGDGLELIFEGNVIDFTKRDLDPNKLRVEINAEDGVFHELKKPIYNETWATPTQVAINESEGTPGQAILNTILSDGVPDIDRGGINSVDVDIKYAADGYKIFDIVRDLADVTYSTFHSAIDSSGNLVFYFRRHDDVDSGVSLADEDYNIVSQYSEEWIEPVNDLLFVGGEKVETVEESTSVDHYETLNPGDTPLSFSFDFPYPEIRNIDLFTDNPFENTSVSVSVQADDGAGSPLGLMDPDYDIISGTIDSTSDLEGGSPVTTVFDIGRWLGQERGLHGIIKTEYSPVDIGVSSGGTPAYAVDRPRHVVTRVIDKESIDTYGRIRDKVSNPDITNYDLARQLARSIVSARKEPKKRMTIEPLSTDILDVRVGELIWIDSDRFGLSESFEVKWITERYRDSKLEVRVHLKG